MLPGIQVPLKVYSASFDMPGMLEQVLRHSLTELLSTQKLVRRLVVTVLSKGITAPTGMMLILLGLVGKIRQRHTPRR
jgi:hypothetical protein